MSTKYLYLKAVDHVAAWTDGGEVPLSLASAYLAIERHETMTPDETYTHTVSNLSQAQADGLARNIDFSGGGGGLHARTVKHSDGTTSEDVHWDVKRWDGLVLCMSNSENKEICKRMGKLACVAIDSPEQLFRVITAQLGIRGTHQCCLYTAKPDREPFLKSSRDAWQDEYRMFWRGGTERMVTIPPRTARFLWDLRT